MVVFFSLIFLGTGVVHGFKMVEILVRYLL